MKRVALTFFHCSLQTGSLNKLPKNFFDMWILKWPGTTTLCIEISISEFGNLHIEEQVSDMSVIEKKIFPKCAFQVEPNSGRVAWFLLVQHTKTGKNIPNNHKMATKYTKWLQNKPNGHKIYIRTSSIARPSKIYPNCDFWFDNTPSGNPELRPDLK
jgi:hypothetical protein